MDVYQTIQKVNKHLEEVSKTGAKSTRIETAEIFNGEDLELEVLGYYENQGFKVKRFSKVIIISW